jgi:hypothetical protein
MLPINGYGPSTMTILASMQRTLSSDQHLTATVNQTRHCLCTITGKKRHTIRVVLWCGEIHTGRMELRIRIYVDDLSLTIVIKFRFQSESYRLQMLDIQACTGNSAKPRFCCTILHQHWDGCCRVAA